MAEAPDRILLMRVPVNPPGTYQWRENGVPGSRFGIDYIRADWEVVTDEWSEDIHAAFPTRSDSHEEYATAMQMVGHRHSKGALVALVNWLLVRLRKADDECATMAETLRIAQTRCTELLEEVRRLRPKPPLCQCAVGSDGQRYAHGACMAFHTMKAVGHINAEGKLMRGDFAGVGR